MPTWKNINPDFTPELQEQWESNGFAYSQVKEWIDIGLTPTDANFCAWLRTHKRAKALAVLNGEFGEIEELRSEYDDYNNSPPKTKREQVMATWQNLKVLALFNQKWLVEAQSQLTIMREELNNAYQRLSEAEIDRLSTADVNINITQTIASRNKELYYLLTNNNKPDVNDEDIEKAICELKDQLMALSLQF